MYGISDQFSREFDALIDTGFTGFLMLPLTAALPLGLTLLGTSTYTLADGSTSTNLIAFGTVSYEGQDISGPISLENNSSCTDVLLGMDYIRQSKQMLIVCEVGAVLLDMGDALEAMKAAKAAQDATASIVQDAVPAPPASPQETEAPPDSSK